LSEDGETHAQNPTVAENISEDLILDRGKVADRDNRRHGVFSDFRTMALTWGWEIVWSNLSATARKVVRLGCDMGVETLGDLLLCDCTLAGPADPDGVDQGKEVIQRPVTAGGTWHAGIERRHGGTLHAPVRIGPDRTQLA
jgi:hypothetical protein